MAENSLSPAFVRIAYKSAYGQHVMTVPSVPYVPAVDPTTGGQFTLRGLAIPTDAPAAVLAFVNLLKPFFKTTTSFDEFVIYTQASPTEKPLPRYAGNLGVVGTSASTAQDKATQETWSFRADDFTLYKLVLLDNPVPSFERQTNIAGSPSSIALRDYITSTNSWISSRGGGRPVTLLQISRTLNEKLRRSYRMN